MNTLLGVRTNIFYAKRKEGEQLASGESEYRKFNEIIFLVDKPEYRRTNDGDIIRERGVEEMRFVVSEETFKAMMTQLAQLQKAKEEDLG